MEKKKIRMISKRIFAFVLGFAMVLVIMPSIPARAVEPTNTWSYDEATNIITINCEVPSHFNVGDPVANETFVGSDSTGFIARVFSVFGTVVTEEDDFGFPGFPYNGKEWVNAGLAGETLIANREYGFIVAGYVTDTSRTLPKFKLNGHEFQTVVSTGDEFFAAISFGVLDESGNLSGGDLGSGGSGSTPDPTPTESAPEPAPDMTTVNIEGATFNTWEEITANTPNLTAEKLHKVNESSDDDLLHVNIVGKEDKTVPAVAVAAMDKSSIGGLHVFIGESDAVTFLNNLDYSKYTGMNFKHEDEVTDNSRTIDFTSKGKLNAVLVFHTLIAPNTKANVYKVVDGKEVFLATLSSNENGCFCFAIDELAKYVIKY